MKCPKTDLTISKLGTKHIW